MSEKPTICKHCGYIVFPGKPHTPNPPLEGTSLRGYCTVVYSQENDFTPDERAIMNAQFIPNIMDQLK